MSETSTVCDYKYVSITKIKNMWIDSEIKGYEFNSSFKTGIDSLVNKILDTISRYSQSIRGTTEKSIFNKIRQEDDRQSS